MRPNCFMASVDLEDAYYSVPIAEEHRKFLGFIWRGTLNQYTCFPNGLACCPRKFTKLLKPIYAELHMKGFANVPYIDDSYLEGDSPKECWLNVKETVTLFQNLGFIVHPVKSVFIPTQKLDFLGLTLDSVRMTIRITYDKVLHLQAECQRLLNKSVVKIRDQAKVIGLMVASTPGVELGMLYYRTLENEKNDALKLSKGDFDAICEISQTGKADLTWWIENILSTEKSIAQQNPDRILRCDASKQGWGAELNNIRTGGRWLPVEANRSINELELEAIFFPLQSLCRNSHYVHIRVESDNTTAVWYVNNMGGSKSRPCNAIARKIWLWSLEPDIWLTASHLPGKENIIADDESRKFNDRTERKLMETVFSDISELWGPLDIDLFASRLNGQIQCYVSWRPEPDAAHVDALSISWSGKKIYAFPPFSIINRCLQKISQDEADGVIVVPVWPTQPFFPTVMMMLIDNPRLLPRKENLLTLLHSPVLHPLRMKLQLMACHVSGKSWKQKEFQMRLNKSCSNH